MKLFLTAIASLSLIATPAMADQRRDDRPRSEHHHKKGINVGTLLLGGIIGAAIVSAARDDEYYDNSYRRGDVRGYGDPYPSPYAYDRYSFPRRPRYYEHYCVTEQHVSRYGEIYFTRVCQ